MKKVAGLLVCIFALPMFAGSAFAQDESRAEISAGWRDYHITLKSVVDPIELESPNDSPEGWYADVAVNLSPKFAIVGEAGGTYHNDAMDRTAGSVRFSESVEITP